MKRLKKNDLESQKNRQKRPDFWGGYSFKPYYFEFWKGMKIDSTKEGLQFYRK